MFENELQTVKSAAELSGLEDVQNIIRNAEVRIQSDKIPNVLIVVDSYGKNELLKILNKLFGTEIQKDVLPGGDTPTVIQFIHGNQVTVEKDIIETGTDLLDIVRIQYGVNIELLNRLSLTVCCGVQLRAIDGDFLDDSEEVILMTNATMALPRSEKEWIQNQLLPYYDGERFSVVLYNKELLNTRKDLDDVCENVRSILAKSHSSTMLLTDVEAVCSRVQVILESSEELIIKRKTRVYKNCVTKALCATKEQLEMSSVDAEKLRAGVERVKATRKDVELSGRIAVQNIVENLYNGLKFEIVNAANEYNDGVYASVSQRLQTTSDDNLEADLKNVQNYLNKAWQHFEVEADKRITDGNMEISQKLAEQIEVDCGNLLQMEEVKELNIYMPDIKVAGIDLSAYGDAKEQKVKSKKITKAALIAGIGLTIIGHPVLGIATVVGSKVYQGFRLTEKKPNADRSDILSSIRRDCDEICKSIVAQISNAMDQVKQETRESVSKAYSDAMESLITAIDQAVEKAELSVKNVKNLRESVDTLTELNESFI